MRARNRAGLANIAALSALAASSPHAVRGDAGSAKELIDQMRSSLNDAISAQKKSFEGVEATVAALRAEVDSAKKRDGETDTKLNAINASIEKHIADVKAYGNDVAKLDKSIADLGKEIDALATKQAALAVNGGAKTPATPELQAYGKAFEAYFRKGEEHPDAGGKYNLMDLAVKAALTSNSQPDGGFTVVPEMETAIDEVLKEVSPMRQVASIRSIGSDQYTKLVNQHGTASGWVGETAARPSTISPTLSELKIAVNEIYAMPAASQNLLDDSRINIAAWLAQEVELEFAAQEGIAFIAGDGVNKPRGILGYNAVANASYAWGNVGYFITGTSGAFAGDPNGDKALIDVYTGLKTPYRRNAQWLMNRGTIGAIRKLKTTPGEPLVMMSLTRDGMIEQLLGRPVVETPDMPDIAANSMSIAFGDFKRAYLIVDRQGIRVLRDPYSAKPYVLFYTTKRVGGGVQNFEAFKTLKFGTS